ncbi:MAG: hypothetical protein ABFS17_01465 [Chloroflexota bacterium]
MDRKPLKDQRYWIIYFLIFGLIGFLPDLLIHLNTPADLVYTGGLINTDDISVYLSAIRQGAQGSWLFTSQFSPEPIPAQVAYLGFILVGKLQSLLGGSTMLWFQALRIGSLAAVGLALKSLLETVFPSRDRIQQTAWLLLLFGSGLGWLAGTIFRDYSALTPDLFTPEWNLLTSLYSSPHFLLGIAGQAWFFSYILRCFNHPARKNVLFGMLSALLIAAAYPFIAPVNGLILSVFFLVTTIKTKKIAWMKIGLALLQSIPLLLSLAYYGLVLPRDPLWEQTLLQNNQIPPPPLIGVLVGFGLLIPLLILSVTHRSKAWGDPKFLIVCWLFGNLAALYLPLSFAGRLVLGVFIPVTLLASEGLEQVFLRWYQEKTTQANQDAFRRAVIWLTVPSTILLVLWGAQVGLSRKTYPHYYSKADVKAVEFLAERTTSNDLVLADYLIGNYLPRESEARVFAGHLNLTMELEEKLELYTIFWLPETSISWRQAMAEEWGIGYIYRNASISGVMHDQIPGTVIYQDGDLTIYRVD